MLRNLYDVIPTYNSEVAFVTSLLHFMGDNGGNLTGDSLYREALNLRNNTMYPGGKGQRPGIFQVMPRSAAQGLWNLQTYANGLTTLMGDLVLRKSLVPAKAGLTPAQTKQARKAAAQMLITQTAVAGVLGLPFAQAILYGLQKVFPEHNVELDIREALASLAGDDDAMGGTFSNMVTTGVPSAMSYGPDVGSRFALAGTFHVSPYSGLGWEQLVGPTGGLLERAWDAIQSGQRGEPMRAAQDLMPNGFRRIWQALEQGKTYQTQSGQMLVDNLSPEEIVARMIGFGPARISRLQDFERLTKVSEDAEKADEAQWTKEQVDLLKSNRDAEVQRNIAQRIADKKTYSPEQLGTGISREYERQTMPVDPRRFGNRATILSQRALRGTLGYQDATPNNMDRLRLQRSVAARLGLQGPTPASFQHAGGLDQLLQMYPSLTSSQASLLLSHASRSRPSPDLYEQLLGGGQ
jgi:hypothetical protein